MVLCGRLAGLEEVEGVVLRIANGLAKLSLSLAGVAAPLLWRCWLLPECGWASRDHPLRRIGLDFVI